MRRNPAPLSRDPKEEVQLVEEVFLLLAMIANETPRAIVPA
jgi:hypothetical protein